MPLRTLAVSAVLLAWTGTVSAQSPGGPDPDFIARVKTWVADYDRALQDFLCTQSMTRYTARDGASPKWSVLERQELDVSYRNGKVGYHRLSLNGHTDRLDQRVKKGYLIPGGEFGTMGRIFEPKVAAEFSMDHRETLDGRAMCVLKYTVPTERTNVIMGGNGAKAVLGYHGYVDADCETAEVRRVRVVTDRGKLPRNPSKGASLIDVSMELDVSFRPVAISGTSYLLPGHAALTGLFATVLTRAEIDFHDYRKYEVSSAVSFDDVR